MKKNLKISIILVIIIVAIVALVIFIYNNTYANKTYTYKCDYYSINIPKDWEYLNAGKNEVNFQKNSVTVANITVEPNFEFDTDDISTIITNWIGMHAYAKGNSTEKNFGTYTVKKVLVGWENSAAQEMRNESPQKDELHYFYISNNNLFIDLNISTAINEKNADSIAKSLIPCL